VLKNKVILGTVQLGIPYGINNTQGKPSEKEAFDILDFAFANDIHTLDTADGYGEALQVIGRHHDATGKSFQIINKFKVDADSIENKLDHSLNLLRCDSLHCYMYHQFHDFESKSVKNDLMSLKERGRISKIGLSLYDTDQLAIAVRDPQIDIIQLPVNLFDLSSEKEELLMEAQSGGKEIHARSVFLQGLFLRDPGQLTGNVATMRPYLERLTSLCKRTGLDVKTAALNFVLHRRSVNYVVLGIEQLAQLRENLALIKPAFDSANLGAFRIEPKDMHLLNPANWKL
jgi:aryl-alcohol dehydrogenase-like predicted oxidoreductase